MLSREIMNVEVDGGMRRMGNSQISSVFVTIPTGENAYFYDIAESIKSVMISWSAFGGILIFSGELAKQL